MVNSVCGIRSTGRICTDLATELEAQGNEVKIAYGRENVPEQFQKYAIRIGTDMDIKLHGVKARLFDDAGFGSKVATAKFIKWVKEYDPDVIHLHNIHGYYINIEILFKYLKKCGKPVIWTLHDCWSFTGHCAYFDYVSCQFWIDGCRLCPQKKEYPKSYFDGSKKNWKKKRQILTGVPNLTIITPSEWLSRLVKSSYLKEYKVETINNGIDINVFKEIPSKLKEQYGLSDKKIILGVASVWDKRKGLDYIKKVAVGLDDKYQVVVIGLTQAQSIELPKNVITISRTDSAKELAAWYSAADVFINPTMEDNYPTTNLEAIACGTPVITFDTGGSPESAELYGTTVPKGDVDSMLEAIRRMCVATPKRHIDSYRLSREAMVEKYLESYFGGI